MKKRIICVLLAVLMLTGCGAEQAPPHSWEADWTAVCPVLAAEPFEGFSLYESNDALYLSGIYYATWVTGEARPHTNEAGEEAEVFDGQIYVIAQEYRSADSAEAGLSQWITREKSNFEAGTAYSVTCNGQDYTILPLSKGGETNPYPHGAAAFARRGEWAVCVEFLWAEDSGGDFGASLEAFLQGLHFSE